MSVKSMFDFKFPASAHEEGLSLATAIGNDMPALEGYIDHEVIQDVKDPGHLMVNTQWSTGEKASAVLGKYNDDAKVQRATELMKAPPSGFVGELLS